MSNFHQQCPTCNSKARVMETRTKQVPDGSVVVRTYSCMDNAHRWTTEEQTVDGAAVHLITHNGKSQTLTAWAKELGIDRSSLRRRLSLGWPLEEALIPGDIRAHREKHNNTELVRDKQRLDWLIANSAKVCHARDGDCCWVKWSDCDGYEYSTNPSNTAREAIDNAMEKG